MSAGPVTSSGVVGRAVVCLVLTVSGCAVAPSGIDGARGELDGPISGRSEPSEQPHSAAAGSPTPSLQSKTSTREGSPAAAAETPVPTPNVASTVDLTDPNPRSPRTAGESREADPTRALDSINLEPALGFSWREEVTCSNGEVDQLRCWEVYIPENLESPDSQRMVKLFVTEVDNGDPAGVGPVVHVQGGPGVGGADNAPNFVGTGFDMIFLDQRGTGASEPFLGCPEADVLWVDERTDDESRRLGEEASFTALQSCSDRLKDEDIDLDQYNTRAAAGDLEILRRLFGYERWSLWAVSYGTRIALTVARDFPHGVRAMVLDSVLPHEVDFWASIAPNALRAFEELDKACQTSACSSDHGSFTQQLAETAQRLDAAPKVVTASRPVSGTIYDYRIDGAELFDMVFAQLYDTAALAALPRQIARADYGGIDELVFYFASRADPERRALSTGLYYSTWCSEEFPFHDAQADDLAVAAGVRRFGTGFEEALGTEEVARVCEIFSVQAAGQLENRAVLLDVPTLIFSGRFDPITPPAWGRIAAANIEGSVYVEMPNHGHGMVQECPLGIRSQFLRDPEGELDLGCVDETSGPDFD